MSETPPRAPRSKRASGCARPLWLSRNALDQLARVLAFPFPGDVGLRDYADEALVLGRHGQTSHLIPRHELERVRQIVVGIDRNQLARGDRGHRHPARVFPLGDRADDDVPICDDAYKPIAVHHWTAPTSSFSITSATSFRGVCGVTARGRSVITSRTFVPISLLSVFFTAPRQHVDENHLGVCAPRSPVRSGKFRKRSRFGVHEFYGATVLRAHLSRG